MHNTNSTAVNDTREVARFRLTGFATTSLIVLINLTADAAAPATPRACVPPPNETCEDAIVITLADLPYHIEAPLGCFNDVIDKPYFDIFYRYDCTVTGDYTIDMCDSSGDTYLRIYTGACGWSGGTEFATADDECPGSPPNADPIITVPLEAGTTYWFELGTWRAEPPWAPPENSPYLFNLSLDGTPAPTPCDGVGMPLTLVGDPGNSPDTNGLGSVPQLIRIGEFEVTNAQYVAFLNAVAVDDPNALYVVNMTDSDRGGILRGGTAGSYAYWVKPFFGDKPVNFLSWLNAARFCNWLHNGKPIGSQDTTTTEKGAYDLSLPPESISREAGARFFIPNHNEWYKAAYYDPDDPGADGGGTTDYWLYPTGFDAVPTQAHANEVGDVTNPGPNVANFDGGADWNGENGNVTTVGSTTSINPWGAFDMGGNVYEWLETLDTARTSDRPNERGARVDRLMRGGDFSNNSILMSSHPGYALGMDMTVEAGNIGLRVAAVICLGDFDGDNDLDDADVLDFDACFTGADGGPVDPECAPGDFDGDGDVDCDDWVEFLLAWTGPGDPPELGHCIPGIPTVSQWGMVVMTILVLTVGTIVFRQVIHRAIAA